MKFFIPWPRYPIITTTGRLSQSKTAGKALPWLSENVINNLPRPVYSNVRNRWRQAAEEAAEGLQWTGDFPCVIEWTLTKRTAQNMDSYAILEGAKSCLDGMVDAGVFPDDNDAYVAGGIARARKGEPLGLHVKIVPLIWRPTVVF